jgi:hypothetical protein
LEGGLVDHPALLTRVAKKIYECVELSWRAHGLSWAGPFRREVRSFATRA